VASSTPHYGFIKPDVGDPNWGPVVNSDLDAIDTAIFNVVEGAVPDATTSSKGIVQLAGDLGGTAGSPTVPGLTSKANDSAVVHNTGAENVAGVKTFTSAPVVPSSSFPESAVTNLTTDLAAKEATANKGAASGYASLGANTIVPTAQLGTGSATSSTFLRGDQSWQTVSSGISIDGAGTGAVAAAHSGDTATASSTQAIAIGKNAAATTAAEAIAIGGGVSATAAPLATGQGGIAIGASDATGVLGARASGANAVAIGSGDASNAGALASNSFAVAIGRTASATGVGGIAIGGAADSQNTRSVAIGVTAQGQTADAVAIGSNVVSNTGTNTIAIGSGADSTRAARATGLGAIAIGSSSGGGVAGAIASGANSIAIGGGNAVSTGPLASAQFGIAIGILSQATASQGVAIGSGAIAGHANAIAIGNSVATTNTEQLTIGAKRLFMGGPNSAPVDGDLVNSQISFYLDETGNNLKVKVKYAAGTVKIGTLAVV